MSDFQCRTFRLSCAYVGRTKNGTQESPIAKVTIEAIKTLESYETEDYLFPAKANVRFKENFKEPHAWDMGKRFRRVCKLAGVDDLMIHDLRHFAATTMFLKGIPEAIISKMTGHNDRELKGYEHFSPAVKKQTVDYLIASELEVVSGSHTGTPKKTVACQYG